MGTATFVWLLCAAVCWRCSSVASLNPVREASTWTRLDVEAPVHRVRRASATWTPTSPPSTAPHHLRKGALAAVDRNSEEELLARQNGAFKSTQHPFNSSLVASLVTTFDTTDSNDQLFLHMAGQGSGLLFAFTRMNNYSLPHTSHLYVSTDAGRTFRDLADQMRRPDNTPAKLFAAVKTASSPLHYVFTDVEVKPSVIFTSSDACASFSRWSVPFIPSVLQIDPREARVLVALDEKDTQRRLWISRDFGMQWSILERFVHTFTFVKEHEPNATKIYSLYVQRMRPDKLFDIVRFSGYAAATPLTEAVIDGIEEFEAQGDYLFATKAIKLKTGKSTIALWFAYKRQSFLQADFLTEESIIDFHVVNVVEAQIVVAVTLASNDTHLYFSVPATNKFVRSLDSVLFYHPDPSIGRFSSMKEIWQQSASFAEVHPVKGLRGVYIASQLVSDIRRHMGDSVSRLTKDNGATWQTLPPPRLDYHGHPFDCSRSPAAPCSVNFMQKYPVFSPAYTQGLYSAASAPGLLIGGGSVGETVTSGEMGVFVSSNGGLRWREALRGVFRVAVGDHGNVLVAVSISWTKEVLVSWNEGVSWDSVEFAKERMRVISVMSEPGEKAAVFTLFGTLKENTTVLHQWKIIRLNLAPLFNETMCTAKDMKEWYFEDAIPGQFCVMGSRIRYEKKRPAAKCLLGRDFRRDIKLDNCTCQQHDFDCDFGYTRTTSKGQLGFTCTKSGEGEAALPAVCAVGQLQQRTRGFRKIPLDSCVDGLSRRLGPLHVPCPWPASDSFLLVADSKSVRRFNLLVKQPEEVQLAGVLETGGHTVISADYDHSTRCLYWAHVAPGKIMRMCFNGTVNRTSLITKNLEKPVALALDTSSRTLYWLDTQRSAIEAIHTDKSGADRMRRAIIHNHTSLAGATDLVVHPASGHIFWCNPSKKSGGLFRALSDGTDIQRYPGDIFPVSLAVDARRNSVIFVSWGDANIREVGVENFGKREDVTVLYRGAATLTPTLVAVFKDLVFFALPAKQSLAMVQRAVLRAGIIRNYTAVDADTNLIRVFTSEPVNLRNQCGGCPGLCVAMPNNTAKCLCPDATRTVGSDCLCADNSSLAAKGTCFDANSQRCGSGQFQCSDPEDGQHVACIPRVWRCDGEDDCGNNRDEEECDGVEQEMECEAGQVRCSDGMCIHKSWVCDGDNDCVEGSDERNCSGHSSAVCKTPGSFRCQDSGRCVPAGWRCDGEDDCADGSDEWDCEVEPGNSTLHCKDGEFACTRDGTCISSTFQCDGENDCPDGSDENDCHNRSCLPLQFRCANSKCIYETWRCDGMSDCLDGSDEANCSSELDHSKVDAGASFNCADVDMFNCSGSTPQCVPLNWKCDGAEDCSNGMDERGCQGLFPAMATECPVDAVLCVSSGVCLNASARCDGVEQCRDGEDEAQCACATDAEEFDCGADTGHQCIAESWVCDGDWDCPDGADEAVELCRGRRVQCAANEFRCRFAAGCVDQDKVCDGKADCADGSDETACMTLPGGMGVCAPETPLACWDGVQCVTMEARCNGREDCNDGSDEQGCHSLPDKQKPLRLLEVARDNVTASAAYLWWEWDGAARSATQYVLSVLGEGHSPLNYTIADQPRRQSKLVENLTPYTKYRAAIYSLKKKAVALRTVTFITKMTKPSAVRNVHVNQFGADQLSLRISWDAPLHPNGQIRKYRITLSTSGPPPAVATQSVSGSEFSSIFYHPTLHRVYNVSVQAVVGSPLVPNLFESDPSVPVSHLVSGEALTVPVRNLSASSNKTCVALQWSPPLTGAVAGYRIKYRVLDVEKSVECGATQWAGCGFAPGTLYRLFIAAFNKIGEVTVVGPAAEMDVTTKGKLVRPPWELQAARGKVSLERVTVSWKWALEEAVEGMEAGQAVFGVYLGSNLQENVLRGPQLNVTGKREAVLKEVDPCRDYVLQVRVLGPGLHTAFSPALLLPASRNVAQYVSNLKVAKLDDRKHVNVSWTCGCGGDTAPVNASYLIQLTNYSVPEGSAGYEETIEVPFAAAANRSQRIRVRMGARYAVKVIPNAQRPYSSNPVLFTSATYATPEQVYAARLPNGSILLTWQPPKSVKKEGQLVRYRVAVSGAPIDKPGEDAANVMHYDADNSSLLLHLPDVVGFYNFRVAVADGEGNVGDYSSNIAVAAVIAGAMDNGAQGSEDTSDSAGLLAGLVVLLLLIAAVVAVVVVRWRRQRRRSKEMRSHLSSHFRNAPYGLESLELDDEEDMPVFRNFADDEPLVANAS
ncbi:sortilin-related receptor-like [Paramacrobiotus metropolitanus]|uniref:sortilin-related receptor-like n=1 Tax=Paramacrobiotus metropolitanus TaxID=2943436 RepID=UPI0024463999|nr:sortilin-related receptor-like [Paramacrobiotus metropolitanus]